MMPRQTIHATALAIGRAGVLLRGPSGAGKSDLALRCLALAPSALVPQPFRLVADDRVAITVGDGVVELSAPETIAGLIEVRGVGILPLPAELVLRTGETARLELVIDLVGAAPERMAPDEANLALVAGIGVPRLAMIAFEGSTPLKIAMVLLEAARRADGGDVASTLARKIDSGSDRGGTPRC